MVINLKKKSYSQLLGNFIKMKFHFVLQKIFCRKQKRKLNAPHKNLYSPPILAANEFSYVLTFSARRGRNDSRFKSKVLLEFI